MAVAGRPVGIGLTVLPVPVVLTGDADIQTGAGLGQPVGGQRRVLQRLPGHLEQQAVLRVEPACLPRTDSEEGRVEIEHLVEEATP